MQGKARSITVKGMRLSAAEPSMKHTGENSDAAGRWQSPWTIFWIGLSIRLAYIPLAHMVRISALDDHFAFGYEMGRIARALAEGRGYADPFHGQTGPTAWVTPLFPLILAGIFKVFGVYSRLSAWAILSFDSLLNALMIPLIWETGKRCFDLRVARWSAWIWALYPAAMQYAVKWVWEMTLTALLFQLAMVIALRVGNVGSEAESGDRGAGQAWGRWLGFGLVWGLLALSNPGVLLFLPVCGIWMLARSGKAWPRHLPKAFCAGLVFLTVLAPWSWRNERVFHAFVPLRTNFGVELYLGNGPGAAGFLMEYDHPSKDLAEFEIYRQEGELAYAAWRGAEAKAEIRADLPRFFRLCLTRVYFYWFGVPNPGGHWVDDLFRGLNFTFASLAGALGLGLAVRRRIPGAWMFAAAFLLLPAAYYITAAHARFRHPLEPLMTVLGVYLFQRAERRWGFTLPGLRRLWPAR